MVRVIVTKKFYFSWDFLWMEFSCLRAQSPWCPHLISMELFVLIKERVRAQLGLWWWGSVGSSGLGKLLGATCLFILLMKKVRLKKKWLFQVYWKHSGQSEPRFPQNAPQVLLVGPSPSSSLLFWPITWRHSVEGPHQGKVSLRE